MANGTSFGIANLAGFGVALLLATTDFAVFRHIESPADSLGLVPCDPPVACDVEMLAPPDSVMSQVAAILDDATPVTLSYSPVCPLGAPLSAACEPSPAASAPPVATTTTVHLDAADLVIPARASGTTTTTPSCRHLIELGLLMLLCFLVLSKLGLLICMVNHQLRKLRHWEHVVICEAAVIAVLHKYLATKVVVLVQPCHTTTMHSDGAQVIILHALAHKSAHVV